jgi:hypothetical protein
MDLCADGRPEDAERLLALADGAASKG